MHRSLRMEHLPAILLLLCCFLLDFACCSAAENGTEVIQQPGSGDRQGRMIPGVSSLLARFAIKTMVMKVLRVFSQYFVDIFLGEIIGARGLADSAWSFQWPSWLTTSVDAAE